MCARSGTAPVDSMYLEGYHIYIPMLVVTIAMMMFLIVMDIPTTADQMKNIVVHVE